MTTVQGPARTAATSPQLGAAAIAAALAGLFGGGIGLLIALAGLTGVAWAWQKVTRMTAIILTIVTVALGCSVLFGYGFGTVASTGHSGGVAHHVSTRDAPPAP